MTLPTQPPETGVPQTPKPKQITGEKTLLHKIALNFGLPGPGWTVTNIMTDKTLETEDFCIDITWFPDKMEQSSPWSLSYEADDKTTPQIVYPLELKQCKEVSVC